MVANKNIMTITSIVCVKTQLLRPTLKYSNKIAFCAFFIVRIIQPPGGPASNIFDLGTCSQQSGCHGNGGRRRTNADVICTAFNIFGDAAAANGQARVT